MAAGAGPRFRVGPALCAMLCLALPAGTVAQDLLQRLPERPAPAAAQAAAPAAALATAPASAPAVPATAAPAAGEGFINFSFDQVAIPTFARLVGELTGRKLVVAEEIKGRITVISPRIRREEAYPLFVSILETAGCSVIVDGDLHRVVPLADRATPMAPVVGVGETLPDEGIVTKVFRLEHVTVAEMRKVLEPKIRGGKMGAVGIMEETNHLLITDTAESVRRVERIVAEIDQPGLARITELVPLEFASAEEVARDLNDTLGRADSPGEQLRRRLPATSGEGADPLSRQPVVVASTHANSLLLVGTATQLQGLRELIRQLDTDTPTGRGRLNAIFLKYIQAEEAARGLKALLAAAEGGTPGAAGLPGAGRTRRSIAIEPSPENNALLVDASPGDFEVVRKLIEQLDRMPEQVHIEVLIAELTEGEGVDFGVTMAALDLPSRPGDSVLQGSSALGAGTETILNTIQQGVFPGGLTLGVAQGTRLDAEGNVVIGYPGVININAIKSDSRFKIRSNPSLMAQNNREASVSIVNEIPVLTSTIQGGTGSTRDIIQNIERVDVGIKLKLTPHIIPGGEVRMELSPSIEAVIDSGTDGQGLTPTIAKREVSTTVTVRDGEVIVIAGLTREDEVWREQRVPFLGSIPLVGWLFRSKKEAVEKTNLLVFVRPTIVRGSADAAAVREALTERTGLSAHELQR